jgi:chemotaxis protein methyltransferase WspC
LINKKAFRKIRQDARIRRNNYDQPQKKLPVKKPQPEINDEIDISAADIRKMADQGRYDEALRKCNIYLREKSHDAEIYYLAGLINEALSNQDRAVESYNKTLYLDPGHREALVNLSLIYENRGEIRKAELLRRRAEKH